MKGPITIIVSSSDRAIYVYRNATLHGLKRLFVKIRRITPAELPIGTTNRTKPVSKTISLAR